MSWGTRRRNTIIILFFIGMVASLGYYLFTVLYKPPTCFDGVQNGAEVGIDCGGVCELLCKQQVIEPIVHWRRLFEVAPGVYNVLAYVENPNPNAGVAEVSYAFDIYDNDNVLLQRRTGTMRLPPKAIIPVIENTLSAGKLQAIRVSFSFTEPLVWKRENPEEPVLVIENEEMIEPTIEPRIEATVRNLDVRPVDRVRMVAIIYDAKDNAIASSSTLIDRVPALGTVPVFFTWPQPFSVPFARFELIPLYERSVQ